MRYLRLFRRDPPDEEWLPLHYEQALLVPEPLRLDHVQAWTPSGRLMALEPVAQTPWTRVQSDHRKVSEARRAMKWDEGW